MTKRRSRDAGFLSCLRVAALAACALLLARALAPAPALAQTAGGTPGQAEPQGPLTRLAQPGPWPGVSRLIAFAGGIWFVNSDPFANFNAADIYRYDPAAKTARYERGLFSQNAGAPTVYRGWLFWPFEDPRSNVAVGEFAVTDGNNWRWDIMGAGITLHVQAMRPCGNMLLAATGGWNGALQASPDGLNQWREIFRLPDNIDGFSRVSALGSLGSRCFFATSESGKIGPRMLEWTDAGARPLAGWPDAASISSLVEHRGALYAINRGVDGTSLWRHDGADRAERLTSPGDRSVLEALASTGDRLLAVTSDGTGGALWESPDGTVWTLLQRFADERPIDLLAVGADIYVGTFRSGGRGALWGPADATEKAPGGEAAPLDAPLVAPLDREAMQTSLRTIETALVPKPDYMSYRTGLLGVALPLAQTRDPLVGVFLAKRARKTLPAGEMMTFTEHVYTNEELARWLLLYAAGIAGRGYVPPEWLTAPWQAAPRPSEKYFETTLAAIRAVGRFGQNAADTIDILVARLASKSDPAWLKGDIVAALNELTGQHFGHDLTAWQSWWKEARATWPPEGN